MSIADLKDKLRTKRDSMDQSHATRLHRALSWMACAEEYNDDYDVAFITKWIAFNSCYSIFGESEQLSERHSFRKFVDEIIELDTEKKIYNCIWFNFSGFVRSVINNQYVFSPFWESQNNGDDNWQTAFQKSQATAMSALANQDVSLLLSIVMDRLYVLRNQLMHGGATYQSKVNREQVKDGQNLLGELLPIIIEIMLDNENGEWGEIYYPVVG